MAGVLVEIRSGAGTGPRRVHRSGPVQIGRGPENDLVIQDPEVSWRHALIYEEGGAVWLRDLGSRNGTEVDGQRVTSPTRLSERSRIRIGPVELGVGSSPSRPVPLQLEEAGTGVRHPLLRERFVIGPSPGSDLQHPGLDAPITLLVQRHGEVWVGHDDEDFPLDLGQRTEVAGFAFTVVEADPMRVPTVEADGGPYRYALQASLDAGPGPVAVLRDPGSGQEARFTAETRATLLYTLGCRVVEDRAHHVSSTDEGWVGDPELVIAVWGKTPLHDGLARLKTLLHRVRSDCREAGLDPWCVEKRRGFTRLRVEQARVT